MPAPDHCNLFVWTVKPDREDDFIACWQALADWTLATFPGARSARLMRDARSPRRFTSMSDWDDADSLGEWRRHDDFQSRISACRACCEDLDASELSMVAEAARQPVA